MHNPTFEVGSGFYHSVSRPSFEGMLFLISQTSARSVLATPKQVLSAERGLSLLEYAAFSLV